MITTLRASQRSAEYGRPEYVVGAPEKCSASAPGSLRACRQAYAAGIGVLYSTNTFFIESVALWLQFHIWRPSDSVDKRAQAGDGCAWNLGKLARMLLCHIETGFRYIGWCPLHSTPVPTTPEPDTSRDTKPFKQHKYHGQASADDADIELDRTITISVISRRCDERNNFSTGLPTREHMLEQNPMCNRSMYVV